MTPEHARLDEDRDKLAPWKQWGPYLAERAWGTVREDYSANGAAWDYFPHDHARSRVYRWNEDGLAGICDDRQYLCFALALWNGNDSILKERLFGLSGPEGNHGEDVKECYYYLDSTPTHSYMKMLYKYPQAAFPYAQMVEENRRRGRLDPEFELMDTGIFNENRYFDVTVEYAKSTPKDILIQITARNCGPDAAVLHLLPTLWFRNTWVWGYDDRRPLLKISDARDKGDGGDARIEDVVVAQHYRLGTTYFMCEAGAEFLFTENETNHARVFPPDGRNSTPFVKDSIHEYIVGGRVDAVNPQQVGTKCAVHYNKLVSAGEEWTIRLRLSESNQAHSAFGDGFDQTLALRKQEADAFYATVAPKGASSDLADIQRQALAGMLCSKQVYRYNIRKWLNGDPAQPTPPDERWKGRNRGWTHLDIVDVLSMPDKWEYPWFAAWDLAFHCIPLALVDSEFAKRQLLVMLREWYMHPNGQLPAYEWSFSDVNPPVHAWATLRVYQIERRLRGVGDTKFLERVFHKLLLNFTWWVNRKDAEDLNIFQGGFLGLDNIGVFDRSAPLPTGGHLNQSDGTSWMAMYCLNMLGIALELASQDDSYEDVATKFMEHFFFIAHAMNDRPATRGDSGDDLWDADDGFYYDVLNMPNGEHRFLRVRSMVGLIPLLAVETLDCEILNKLPNFRFHFEQFLASRPDLSSNAAPLTQLGQNDRRLFSVVSPERLRLILYRMLDEREFLSPYGLRSLSLFHQEHPYRLQVENQIYHVNYEPAESSTGMFGGNSNWRGPIWMPLNYLIIEALQKFDFYFGPEFTVECPTGSGVQKTLWEVSRDLSQRLMNLFIADENGHRPANGAINKFQTDPDWRRMIQFHEYFHGDNGAGLGASHQTGWTGLVAKLIQQTEVNG